MYSAGLNSPTGEGKTELIGNLSLVGVKGNFCAVLSEKQLTLERIDGKGLRLNLASINETRALKIPYLPNGLVPLGIISIGLGISAMTLPFALIPIFLGIFAISLHTYSRYPIMAIETFSGNRHLISGSNGVLLRLAIMISRISSGLDINEAKLGLENLDNEIPKYPSISNIQGVDLENSKDSISQLQLNQNNVFPLNNGNQHQIKHNNTLEKDIEESENSKFHSDSILNNESAYEAAWGGRTPPPWYSEKEDKAEGHTRIDSVLTEAADQLDMFGSKTDMFGGLFDSDSYEDNNMVVENDINMNFPIITDETESSISSSQMIKRAYESHGEPDDDYGISYKLPSPNKAAVREECKPGIVNQARATQELKIKNNELNYTLRTSNLEEYPALRNLAYKRADSRIKLNLNSTLNSKISWIDRLLRPSSQNNKLKFKDSSNYLADPDARFQTSQHLRLRSDQEHQSDVGIRVRRLQRNNNSNESAKKALNQITSRVLNGGHQIEKHSDLRFNQLRSSNSKSSGNIMPGIKKLL